MNLSICSIKEARHKRIHTPIFNLYEVLKEEKLIYGNRNPNSGCLWGMRKDLAEVIFWKYSISW